ANQQIRRAGGSDQQAEISQSSLVDNGGCAVSGCQSGKRFLGIGRRRTCRWPPRTNLCREPTSPHVGGSDQETQNAIPARGAISAPRPHMYGGGRPTRKRVVRPDAPNPRRTKQTMGPARRSRKPLQQ